MEKMKKMLFSFLAIILMTTVGCKQEILLPEFGDGDVISGLYQITVDVPATEGHDNGGILVTTVLELNDDEEITEDEIVGIYTVWHGNNGGNGVDGTNGIDGKSPYVEDGEWFYWSIETNTWISGGKSVGEDGADGEAGIDGESPYILNGDWYFWNGTEWINGGKSTGNTGEKGDKGDTGDTGTPGENGDKGDTGEGEKGDTGTPGENGTITNYIVSTALNCNTNGYRLTMIIDEGLSTEYILWFEVCDGEVGDVGAVGAQGPKGDKGDKGDDGEDADCVNCNGSEFCEGEYNVITNAWLVNDQLVGGEVPDGFIVSSEDVQNYTSPDILGIQTNLNYGDAYLETFSFKAESVTHIKFLCRDEGYKRLNKHAATKYVTPVLVHLNGDETLLAEQTVRGAAEASMQWNGSWGNVVSVRFDLRYDHNPSNRSVDSSYKERFIGIDQIQIRGTEVVCDSPE